MKLLLGLSLLALLPAVAQTKCHKTVPETIPYAAVEPAFNSGQPYCPRNDYELKWFVSTSHSTSGYLVYSNGGVSPAPQGTGLMFVPMCIEVELVNDTESHFTIKMKANN
jgi:hypothetical protein